MNFLLAIIITCGLDVYFLKDSPDLLVRVVPEYQIEQLTLHYSFAGTLWGSMTVEQEGAFFDAVIKTPLDAIIVGLYAIYYDGTVDNDDGQPYMYELSIYPRMLMPFSITDLEVVIAQARRKIATNTHVDEAIALLEYADGILKDLPVIPDSPGEVKRDVMQTEVDKLKAQVGR
jgi:hypothetical protein